MIAYLAYASAAIFATANICLALFCRAEWRRKAHMKDDALCLDN
jgi:hypothetical protein